MYKSALILFSYIYLIPGGAFAQSSTPLFNGGWLEKNSEFDFNPSPAYLLQLSVHGEDINNDGISDLLVIGTNWDSIMGQGNSSQVHLLAIDGSSGNTIWEIDYFVQGNSSAFCFEEGELVITKDINNDGVSDICWGSPCASTNGYDFNGYIRAIDGSNGNTLWEISGDYDRQYLGMGTSPVSRGLTICDDISNDGVDDLYVGCSYGSTNGYYQNGYVRAIDSSNGNTIWEISGNYDSAFLGNNITIGDDINNDSLNDFYLGDPGASTNGYNQNGYVRAMDGSNGNTIWEISGNYDSAFLGNNITIGDDINNDGLNDLYVGSHWVSTNGYNQNGYVRAMDGSNGNTIWEISGNYDSALLGEEITICNDINNNGVNDLYLVQPSASTNGFNTNGYIRAIDSSNGNTIWEISGNYDSALLGKKITIGDDINNDGVNDLYLGQPTVSTNGLHENGYVRAIDNSNGNTIWETFGNYDYARLGNDIIIGDDINNDVLNDLYLGQGNALIRAIDSSNGNTLWETAIVWGSSYSGFGEEITICDDISNDGVNDIIYSDEATAIDGMDGSILMQTAERFKIFGRLDMDNDGYPELIAAKDGYSYYDVGIKILNGKISEGMTSSASMLSAGQGGNIFYDLDYPDSCAFYRYSLLFSMTSGSVNIQGLNVPLGYDLWLSQSYSGIYPQPFMYPTGFLDADGDAQAGLSVPQNKIPASMIGTTINFASIVRLAWGEWELSSRSVPLLITP